jgi:hypothetical protein
MQGRGLALSGEWMTLEGVFDGDELYCHWFICQKQLHWEGYDPLTNRCHTGPSLAALKVKIDQNSVGLTTMEY